MEWDSVISWKGDSTVPFIHPEETQMKETPGRQ